MGEKKHLMNQIENKYFKSETETRAKKRKNLGYSLVELVVVVLIIAILAVSLAPQVFKWVEHSRNATDEQTKNTLLEYCGFALTDEVAFKLVSTEEYEIHIVKDSYGFTTYKYQDRNGVHIGAANVHPENDAYWAKLLECIGIPDYETFEQEIKIESQPEAGEVISIDIYIYRGGYTYGYLHGIDNEMVGIQDS